MEDEIISTSKYVSGYIKKKQEQLYKLSHDYLVDNFYKFSEANRLKISLVICTKMVPTQATIEGNYSTINKMEVVKVDDKTQELDIGGNRIAQTIEHSN